ENLRGRMVPCDQGLDPIHGNSRIVPAEMRNRCTPRRLAGKLRRHEAAIIGRSGSKVGADLRHPPRDRPAIAIAGDEDRTFPFERVDAALRILQALLEGMKLTREFHRSFELRPRIVAFEPRML